MNRPFAIAFGITITGSRAQFHVNLNESTLTSREIIVTMITFKAKVMVVVHVHSISMVHKEFDSTVLTDFLFTGVGENKGGGDGVCHVHVFPHVTS